MIVLALRATHIVPRYDGSFVRYPYPPPAVGLSDDRWWKLLPQVGLPSLPPMIPPVRMFSTPPVSAVGAAARTPTSPQEPLQTTHYYFKPHQSFVPNRIDARGAASHGTTTAAQTRPLLASTIVEHSSSSATSSSLHHAAGPRPAGVDPPLSPTLNALRSILRQTERQLADMNSNIQAMIKYEDSPRRYVVMTEQQSCRSVSSPASKVVYSPSKVVLVSRSQPVSKQSRTMLSGGPRSTGGGVHQVPFSADEPPVGVRPPHSGREVSS